MRTAVVFPALLLAAALLPGVSTPAFAKKEAVYTGIVSGVAVGGYDPVSYFTDGKPVIGNPAITLEHGGATWRFASEASRDVFKADPSKYAPQYGGYCAYAVSQGYTAKGDPTAWTVVGGKLYLNYNQSVKRDWDKSQSRYITAADANWPKVLAK